ncbi:MAG: N(4)-(beta-N-acetylglucosaminyl)-L-asparaginase, partial [Sphingomonas sp.]
MPFSKTATATTAGRTGAVVLSTWDFGAAANAAAFARLAAGGSLIDAVEAGAMVPEADPTNHSVGYSGYPDRDGHVTLDAVIMDDAGGVGAVAALEDTVHAISVARRVMERTPHTFLVGEGATRFARDQGFLQRSLLTPESEKAWREWLVTAIYQPQANSEVRGRSPVRTPGGALDHDTIGLLARTADGRMAGACTTSGMAFKMRGRVGDSPQVGSGLYVEAGVGGATST